MDEIDRPEWAANFDIPLSKRPTLKSILGSESPPYTDSDFSSGEDEESEIDFSGLSDNVKIQSIEDIPSLAVPLIEAQRKKFSDVHFTESHYCWFRQGGRFFPDDSFSPPSRADMANLVNRIGGLYQSGVLLCKKTRWRINVYTSEFGLRAACRIIPDEPLAFGQLGLPDDVRSLIGYDDGLVVIAGSTGSGKTTTVATMIDLISQSREAHIMTIENPVEYIFQPRKSLISQQNVPEEERLEAMKSVLRSDPNVVLIGECRDAAEFSMCMELAATGHLVFTTLHARDCATVAERVHATTGEEGRSMFSQVLRAVVSQKLVPDRSDRKKRHLVAEVAMADDTLLNFLRPGGNLNGIRQHLHSHSISLDWQLARHARNNKISGADAEKYAISLNRLRELISTD